jgi:hypothetical protein
MSGSVNGNGHSNGNGHTNGHSPTFTKLNGASVRTFESVHFDVSSLSEALDLIKRLGKSGELTVRFHRGSAAGNAEFKTAAEKS